MMKNIIKILLIVLVATNASYSQEKKMQKAKEDFDKFAFVDARKVLLKVAENGYQSQDLFQRLGDSYYNTAELIEAEKWYGLLIGNYGESVDSEYFFKYSQTLKSIKQYAAADRMMNKFYESKPSDTRARIFENEKNYLELIEKQSGRFELSTLDINSSNSDYAPSFYMGNLVFASTREQGNITKNIHEWNNQPFSDLFSVSIGSESSPEITKLSKKINTKYHESTAVFSKDGNTIYFTRNNYTNKKFNKNSEGTNLLKLYRSKKVDGKWQQPEELPFNSDEYSVAHPTLSPDEDILYFASDMPGGKGMSDLYKVTIEEDTFGAPINLGEEINTEGRETFPFVASDGSLYFASDGHPGLGGLDVFVAKNDNKNYGEGFNLGSPVNTEFDDFSFIINPISGLGYFASNREEGKGSDDVYAFKQIEKPINTCIQVVDGTVRNKDTDEIITQAKVLLLDEDNNVLGQTISTSQGLFTFAKIDCGKAYSIKASKEEYNPDTKSFITENLFSGTIKKTLYLDPKEKLEIGADLNKILDLNLIYFDLDKSFIRTDAEIELQKVIAVMKEYPNLKIDVRSHTDSRNTHAYNLKLSQRRNVATLAYIIDKGGISVSRLTGRGYGETQLVNACADGIECSEEMHQQNRRSEFIIVDN